MNKEEQEQKYALLQMLDQQLKQTQKQIKNLQSQQENLIESVQALEELGQIEVGAAILFPITNGVFVKGTLTERDMVTVNIGAKTAVQKTREGARQLLTEQYKEVEGVLSQLASDFKEMYSQAKRLEEELAQCSVS